MRHVSYRVSALLLTVLLAAVAAAAQTAKTAEALSPSEQKAWQPGYAVGDIAIGNPKVADFKVMPGRRELLLFGLTEGQTTLTIWDQQRNKRHEVVITVRTPVDPQIEREIKLLLQDFPSVEVHTLGGQPVLTGAVSSQDDLAAVDKIAAAARVRSLVRYVAPVAAPRASVPAAPASTIPAPSAPAPAALPSASGPVAPPAGPASVPTSNTPAKPASPVAPALPPSVGPYVEYEIELLEASARFRSGSYATGIEPSGRRLYIGKVAAPIGADGEVFIGGKAVTGKDKAAKTPSGTEQGIRLTLRPDLPDARGRFRTGVLVQTNLPIGSDTYDPESWRRARWEFAAASGEPFGITGSDLMAAPDLGSGGPSAMGTATRGASKVSGMPRMPNLPGTEFVPVFGSLFGSSSYKEKQSQLLVIIRPRLVAGGGQ